MKQVFTFFKLLSSSDEKYKEVKWELVSIKMDSPPIITARPVSFNKKIDVAALSEEAINDFDDAFFNLYEGRVPKKWSTGEAYSLANDFIAALTNGLGRVKIEYDDFGPLQIDNQIAKRAYNFLHKKEKFFDFLKKDRKRTEVGSVEGRIIAVGEYKNTPAIQINYRLKKIDLWVVVPKELRDKIRLSFEDVWENKRIIVKGDKTYSESGKLTKVIAKSIHIYKASDVNIEDLYDSDYTDGLSAVDYINKIRSY
ncbi:MAG: hypothetical protein PHV85_07020 [Desulfovibrionaceae bacterium]|nr:hypothetical protein [Desulfovibrionaceae bacterium]